jgi:membrane-associated phospholipid phosphatase
VDFREFMLAVSATFWFCYLHFLFTPAVGPIFWADYPVTVLRLPGGPVTVLEQWLFHTWGMQGGAFPSSHVAAAIVMCGYAVRHRIAPLIMVPLTIGLAISTMYHGYHYGVDVLYGFVVGAVALWLLPRTFRRHDRRSQLALDHGPRRSASVL